MGSSDSGRSEAGERVGSEGTHCPIGVADGVAVLTNAELVSGSGNETGEGVGVTLNSGGIVVPSTLSNGFNLNLVVVTSTTPYYSSISVVVGYVQDGGSATGCASGGYHNIIDTYRVERGGVVPTETDVHSASRNAVEAYGIIVSVNARAISYETMIGRIAGGEIMYGNEAATKGVVGEVSYGEGTIGAGFGTHPEAHGKRVHRIGELRQADILITTIGGGAGSHDERVAGGAIPVGAATYNMRLVNRVGTVAVAFPAVGENASGAIGSTGYAIEVLNVRIRSRDGDQVTLGDEVAKAAPEGAVVATTYNAYAEGIVGGSGETVEGVRMRGSEDSLSGGTTYAAVFNEIAVGAVGEVGPVENCRVCSHIGCSNIHYGQAVGDAVDSEVVQINMHGTYGAGCRDSHTVADKRIVVESYYMIAIAIAQGDGIHGNVSTISIDNAHCEYISGISSLHKAVEAKLETSKTLECGEGKGVGASSRIYAYGTTTRVSIATIGAGVATMVLKNKPAIAKLTILVGSSKTFEVLGPRHTSKFATTSGEAKHIAPYIGVGAVSLNIYIIGSLRSKTSDGVEGILCGSSQSSRNGIGAERSSVILESPAASHGVEPGDGSGIGGNACSSQITGSQAGRSLTVGGVVKEVTVDGAAIGASIKLVAPSIVDLEGGFARIAAYLEVELDRNIGADTNELGIAVAGSDSCLAHGDAILGNKDFAVVPTVAIAVVHYNLNVATAIANSGSSNGMAPAGNAGAGGTNVYMIGGGRIQTSDGKRTCACGSGNIETRISDSHGVDNVFPGGINRIGPSHGNAGGGSLGGLGMELYERNTVGHDVDHYVVDVDNLGGACGAGGVESNLVAFESPIGEVVGVLGISGGGNDGIHRNINAISINDTYREERNAIVVASPESELLTAKVVEHRSSNGVLLTVLVVPHRDDAAATVSHIGSHAYAGVNARVGKLSPALGNLTLAVTFEIGNERIHGNHAATSAEGEGLRNHEGVGANSLYIYLILSLSSKTGNLNAVVVAVDGSTLTEGKAYGAVFYHPAGVDAVLPVDPSISRVDGTGVEVAGSRTLRSLAVGKKNSESGVGVGEAGAFRKTIEDVIPAILDIESDIGRIVGRGCRPVYEDRVARTYGNGLSAIAIVTIVKRSNMLTILIEVDVVIIPVITGIGWSKGEVAHAVATVGGNHAVSPVAVTSRAGGANIDMIGGVRFETGKGNAVGSSIIHSGEGGVVGYLGSIIVNLIGSAGVAGPSQGHLGGLESSCMNIRRVQAVGDNVNGDIIDVYVHCTAGTISAESGLSTITLVVVEGNGVFGIHVVSGLNGIVRHEGIAFHNTYYKYVAGVILFLISIEGKSQGVEVLEGGESNQVTHAGNGGATIHIEAQRNRAGTLECTVRTGVGVGDTREPGPAWRNATIGSMGSKTLEAHIVGNAGIAAEGGEATTVANVAVAGAAVGDDPEVVGSDRIKIGEGAGGIVYGLIGTSVAKGVDSAVVYGIAVGVIIHGSVPADSSLVSGYVGYNRIGNTGTEGKFLEIYIVDIGVDVAIGNHLEGNVTAGASVLGQANLIFLKGLSHRNGINGYEGGAIQRIGHHTHYQYILIG